MSAIDETIPNAFAQQPSRDENAAIERAVFHLKVAANRSREDFRLQPIGYGVNYPPQDVVGGRLPHRMVSGPGGVYEMQGGSVAGVYAPGVFSESGVLAGSAGMSGYIPAAQQFLGEAPIAVAPAVSRAESQGRRAKSNAAAVGGIRFVDPLLARPIF